MQRLEFSCALRHIYIYIYIYILLGAKEINISLHCIKDVLQFVGSIEIYKINFISHIFNAGQFMECLFKTYYAFL